jgi:hypothetical protein
MSNFLRARNPICQVRFAGFVSTTLELERAGWQLSAEQQWDRAAVRLAMKFEKGGIYAITNAVSFNHFAAAQGQASNLTFDVVWMGNDGRFHIMPEPRALNFRSISAMPEFEELQSWTEVKFEDAIPFKPLNHEAPEIIVAPDKVAEIMDLILKAQDPKQAEIRARKRTEAWRALQEPGRLVDAGGYAPAADIRAQIISLAS